MDAIDCIKKRRSIRSYTEKIIPEEILEDIIACGGLAASGRNIQPVEFLILDDKEIINKISDITGKFKQGVPYLVVIIAKDVKHYLEDGSAATQNVMLAARAHGIGSCWIGAFQEDKVKARLNIPDNLRVVSLLTLGYADEQPRLKNRKKLNEIIHYQQYGHKKP